MAATSAPQPPGALVGLTPELLEKYETALPGLATRLVDAAMEEISHRRAMEKAQLEAEVELMRHQSREIHCCPVKSFGHPCN